MGKPTPAIYKTRNWPTYNEALKRRGSPAIWFDPEMTWEAAPTGRRGRKRSRSKGKANGMPARGVERSGPATTKLMLRQRGEIFEIRNGIDLMSNLNHQSDDQLALRTMRRLDFRAKRVLIGGLGPGYSLRALLDLAAPDTEVSE